MVSPMSFPGLVKGRTPMTYVPNPIGIAAAGASLAMEMALWARALQIVSLAQTIAQQEAFDEGDYYNGLEATHGIDEWKGIPMAAALANAFDFKSAWIEYGSIHNTALHVMTRAAEGAGFHVSGTLKGRSQ